MTHGTGTTTSPDGTGDCAGRLRILADRTRLVVLRLLIDGPLTVGEINEHIGIEQSLLSHHLRVLREAGLVETRREGKSVRYRLERGVGSAGGGAIDLGCCVLTFDPERPGRKSAHSRIAVRS